MRRHFFSATFFMRPLLVCLLHFAVTFACLAGPSFGQQELVPPAPVPTPTHTWAKISSRARINDHGLTSVIERMVGAKFQCEAPHSLRGDLVGIKSHKDVDLDIESEWQASWELRYSGSSTNSQATQADTEIVGGAVARQSSKSNTDQCDLLIKFKERGKPSEKVTPGGRETYNWEASYTWLLNIETPFDDRSKPTKLKARGKLTYYHKAESESFYKDGTVTKEVVLREINSAGIHKISFTSTNSSSSYRGESVTSYYPDGRSHTRTATTIEGETSVTNEEGKHNPMPLEIEWFELSLSREHVKYELEYVNSRCAGVSENPAIQSPTVAPAQYEESDPRFKTATINAKTAISIGGKQFPIEIFEWDEPGAHVTPGAPVSRIYLPRLSNYHNLGISLANELGNLVADGRDGLMDGRCADKLGKPIGYLRAEAISDEFSMNWGIYQSTPFFQGKPTVNPLEEFFPDDLALREILASRLDRQDMLFDRGSLLGSSAEGKDLVGWVRDKKARRDMLSHADELVSKGALKEAFDHLNSDPKTQPYACSFLGR